VAPSLLYFSPLPISPESPEAAQIGAHQSANTDDSGNHFGKTRALLTPSGSILLIFLPRTSLTHSDARLHPISSSASLADTTAQRNYSGEPSPSQQAPSTLNISPSSSPLHDAPHRLLSGLREPSKHHPHRFQHRDLTADNQKP
jgi:hypothetical protein